MRLPDDITIVIAAKDEEPSVADVVRACRPHAAEVLVVVDRRSTDRTAAVAAHAGARVLIDAGRGKGHAMRMAVDEVKTVVTVFVDADGSHDTADIPQLVGAILSDEADHVSASRLMGGSSELHGGFDEFFRLAGSSFITACINRRFKVRLSDSQNGFRAIRTDVFHDLNLSSDSTTIEQEMIMRSLGMGYRVAEVPSHEHKRRFGTSHISVRRAAFRYVVNFVTCLLFTRYPVARLPRRGASRVERGVPVHR
jgi:dolichol-phosphate mannosyltransferase